MKNEIKLLPVILSGGSGSRLWPLSREYYPKQLLAPLGEDSLLQGTACRLTGLEAADKGLNVLPPLVICNEEHRFLVGEQLRGCGQEAPTILLEPQGRNTAPAATLAALLASAQYDANTILLIMPADHLIQDQTGFHKAVTTAVGHAAEGAVVTFGIVPTHAETGYGYIRRGKAKDDAFRIERFVEKPDEETAKGYLESGEYYWNSGLFVVSAATWLARIGDFRPDILEACRTAYTGHGHDGDFIRLDAKAFADCPSDSIDYAVMERLTGEKSPAGKSPGIVIPLDVGWSDIGAWSSLWDVMPKDANGNIAQGDVIAEDTLDSLLMAEHRLLATVGLKDVVVIETADAVLVADKARAQDVRKIVDRLKKDERSEYMTHRCVYRPWGHYEGIDKGGRFQVKRITVNPGATLSLQMHHHRAEHWVVVSGTAKVTRGTDTFILSENESTFIPVGETHRLENPGKLPLEIIEVQSGSYLGEDDIVRYEDNYGRS